MFGFFFGEGMCIAVLGWFCFDFGFLFSPSSLPVPSHICTFIWKKGLSAVIGLGVELIQQNFSGTVVSLSVPLVPAGCSSDYVGNKLLQHFSPSPSLASSKIDSVRLCS